MNKPLTLGSLFSGSGTFEVAGMLSGIVPVLVLKKKPCKCNNHQIFDNTKITTQ